MPNENTLPTPETRREMFLAAAAGESVEKPEPITREEMFLNAIGGGGGSGDAYTKEQTDALLAGKADLTDGKVPASELPSYVDDTVEGYYYEGTFYEDSEHTTAITGERGKIYVDLTTNKSYRWTGAIYTRVDECPAFGETAGTIYEGNKGKANADAIGTIANLTTTATDLVGAVNELNSDKVDKNGTDSLMTAAEHTKLSGIESGAEVNVQSDWNQTDTTADDYIKNKPSIPSGVVVDQVYDGTSTNAQSGVAIAGAISDKVDKVTGKGLSTNDYTTEEKEKLTGIASGAEVNVQSDWSQSDSTADDYIKNKPTIPTVDQSYSASSTNAQSGVAIEGKKPGLKTTGTEYTISGKIVVAGDGAEVFNDLVTNKASGNYSHAEGFVAYASGNYSHAEGKYTTASSDCQHVQGKYNVIDANSTYAFIIGNGKSVMSRHNAFAVDWDGLIYVNGATTGVDVAALAATIGDINTVLEEVL